MPLALLSSIRECVRNILHRSECLVEDVVASLDLTFAHAGAVIAGVRPEHLDAGTPCAEWSVRELLEHMIGVVDGIGHAVAGDEPSAFTLGDDPAAQFAASSTASMAAWRSPGVLEREIDSRPGPMPGRMLAGINLLDTAAHTWDLAVATGQPPELPESVAVAALEAREQIVTAELRPGRFDPEQAVPEGASPTDRLTAFLGRPPA
jgi:uncharacterized protein (TIGR03086 family)